MSNIRDKAIYIYCDSMSDQIDLHYELYGLLGEKDIEVTFKGYYVIIEVGKQENINEINKILKDNGIV